MHAYHQNILRPIALRPNQSPFVLNATKDFFNAIRYADDADTPKLIEQAIAEGANINALDAEGYGALERAVMHNKIRTLKFLFAKGMPLPIVGPEGFDLLMRAANCGYTEIATVLIDSANMTVDASDSNGLTALHYAVKNQHLKMAKMLLEHDCDINAKTTSMPNQELIEIFGDIHNLNGANITPIMIAIANRDHAMVELFLSYKDDIQLHPINMTLQAVDRNDHQILEIFIKNKIFPDYPLNLRLIEHAIKNHTNKNFLQLLLNTIPINQKNTPPVEALLDLAVSKKNYMAASLLLINGIKPVDTQTKPNVWQLAADLPDSGKMLCIMAASHLERWKNISADEAQNLLNLIYETEPSLSAYACIGLLPLTAQQLLGKIIKIQERPPELSETQYKIEISQCLAELTFTNSTVKEFNQSLSSAAFLQSQDSFIELSNVHSEAQIIALKKIGEAIKQNYFNDLQHYLSKNFFDSCHAECSHPEQFSYFIKNKIITASGMPLPVAEIIANGWHTAFSLIKSSGMVRIDSNDSTELIYQLACNLIGASIRKLIIPYHVLTHLSLEKISKTLSQSQRQFDAFCADPIKEIRRLEKRSNLRPVDVASLKAALCKTFGLPPELSEILTQCWYATVNTARNSHNWHNPLQMNDVMQKSFRSYLQNKMQALATDQLADTHPLQTEVAQKLLQWSQSDQSNQIQALGKRIHDAQSTISSISKKPRVEN